MFNHPNNLKIKTGLKGHGHKRHKQKTVSLSRERASHAGQIKEENKQNSNTSRWGVKKNATKDV
jgi:hypothetical protein